MVQAIPVSEVRQKLSVLLKKLRKNPDLTIQITLNGIPVGELKAPQKVRSRVNVGKELFKLGREVGAPEIDSPSGISVSEHHDQFL